MQLKLESKNNELCDVKKEVITFLLLTFSMTYMTNLLVYSKYGSTTSDSIFIGFQMLYPALCAIICQLIFNDRNLNKSIKVVFVYYILYYLTILITIIICLKMNTNSIIFKNIPLNIIEIESVFFSFIGAIILLIVNHNDLKKFKLGVGKNIKAYITLPIVYSLILFVNYMINYYGGFALPLHIFKPLTAITMGVVTFLTIPFQWIAYFGEEYGWRVFLQDRLIKIFGSLKGSLILGIIWGVWHTPLVILNSIAHKQIFFYVIIKVLFCLVTGIIFSFAVLKTNSVWIAVILHYINDSLLVYFNMYISSPSESTLAFVGGFYGIIGFGIFALIMLKSYYRKCNTE